MSKITCRTVKRYFYTSPTGRTKSYHSLFMACKQAAKEELRTLVLGPLVEHKGQMVRQFFTEFLDDDHPELLRAEMRYKFDDFLKADETIPADVRRFAGGYACWVERRAKELAKKWKDND